MIIYYKKESGLTRAIESVRKCTLYKDGGILTKLGLSKRVYPDLYIHSGALNEFSKRLIQNSKITIVNSSILKDAIIKKLGVSKEKIEVILPIFEREPFDKKETQRAYKELNNLPKKTKLIYFTAKDFQKNGFVKFCSILENLEMSDWKAIVSSTNEIDLSYAKEYAAHHKIDQNFLFEKEEIFEVADIFVLPTKLENFSLSVLKAMASKCVVFTTTNNNSIEILDVFAIMDGADDPNISYKIDMLLRVKEEMKKIKKENAAIASRLNTTYQSNRIASILEKLAL